MIIGKALLIGHFTGVRRLFGIHHQHNHRSGLLRSSRCHCRLLSIWLVDISATMEVEYSLCRMLLIVINECLQSIQAFLMERDSEFRFFKHDRLPVHLCFFRNVSISRIDIGKLVAAMLDRQKQVCKPSHKGPVIDDTAVKPETTGSKQQYRKQYAYDFNNCFHLVYLRNCCVLENGMPD